MHRNEIADDGDPDRKNAAGATPAMIRIATNSGKLLINALISVVVTTAARLAFISLVLPKKSAIVPNAGCMSA